MSQTAPRPTPALANLFQNPVPLERGWAVEGHLVRLPNASCLRCCICVPPAPASPVLGLLAYVLVPLGLLSVGLAIEPKALGMQNKHSTTDPLPLLKRGYYHSPISWQ